MKDIKQEIVLVGRDEGAWSEQVLLLSQLQPCDAWFISVDGLNPATLVNEIFLSNLVRKTNMSISISAWQATGQYKRKDFLPPLHSRKTDNALRMAKR